MNSWNERNLERILREYNAEYDVPPDPRIPWYTWMLAEIVKEQQKEIDELQAKLEKLADATGWKI